MTNAAPPGWHPDPADPAMLRWWDGSQWTEHRHPGPGAGGATAASPNAPPWASGGAGTTEAPYGQQPYAQQPYGQQPWGQPGPYGQQPYQGRRMRRGYGRSGRARGPNSLSWTAIGFSAVYIVLALTTGFVLLGIVPVMSSIRAYQRGEKLAPVAIAAAVITVASAVLVLTHRNSF